jgi:hypothetical protein
MKLSKTYSNIHHIFNLEGIISIQEEDRISLLDHEKHVLITPINGFFSGNFYYKLNSENIEIYSHLLDFVKNFPILNPTGVNIFDSNNFVINSKNGDRKVLNFVVNGEIIEVQTQLFGYILSPHFRLNYFDNILNNPTYFRCSDLLDKQTYWEYNCNENEQVTGTFLLHHDKLLFYTKARRELYNPAYWINVIDIKTGKELFKIHTQNLQARFDYERGLYIAAKGSTQNRDNYKFYEIINVNTGEISLAPILTDDNFFGVGTAMQYLHNNKLYFIDNFITIGGIRHNETPKIGCFNFINKELLYFEELPGMKELRVSQIVVNANKIYLRNSKNELMTFEE